MIGSGTYIVGSGVREHVIQSIRLGHVLRSFANDYGKFDFVVWKVLLGWLSGLWDVNRCVWANKGRRGLVE